MAVITTSYGALGNDGFWSPGSFFNNTADYAEISHTVANGFPINAYVRFPTLNLPQGTVVTSAYVSVLGSTIAAGTTDQYAAYAVDTDNVGTITSLALADAAYAIRTSSANINSHAWTAGVPAQMYVTDALQEVLNRAGWVANNAVCFMFLKTGSAGGTGRFFNTLDSGVYNPFLTVVYRTTTNMAGAVTASATTAAAATLVKRGATAVTASATTAGAASAVYSSAANIEATATTAGNLVNRFNAAAAVSATATATAEPDRVILGGRGAMTATATASASGEVILGGSVSMTATVTAVASAWVGEFLGGEIEGTGTAAAGCTAIYSGSVSMSGSAVASASGSLVAPLSGSLTGSCTAVASGQIVKEISGSLTATATTEAEAKKVLKVAGAITATAVTEAEVERDTFAATSLTAQATTAAAGHIEKPVAGALSAEATVADAEPFVRRRNSAAITATATTGATCVYTGKGRAAITAKATATATGKRIRQAAVSLTAKATTRATASAELVSAGSCTASATTAANGKKVLEAAVSLTATGSTAAAPKKMLFASPAALTATASTSVAARLDATTGGSCTASATTTGQVRAEYSGSVSMTGTATTKATYWVPLGVELRKFLLADETVAGLIGTKLYPATAPKTAVRPYVVYWISDVEPSHQNSGFTGLDNSTVEFSCFATSREKARAVGRSIRAALESFSGRMGTKYVQYIEIASDDTDDTSQGFVNQISVSIWHGEPVPVLNGEIIESQEDISHSLVSYLGTIAPVYPAWNSATAPIDCILYEFRELPAYESSGNNDLPEYELQLAMRGRSYLRSHELAFAVRMKLDGLQGSFGETGAGLVKLENFSDTIHRAESLGDRPVHVVSATYSAFLTATA